MEIIKIGLLVLFTVILVNGLPTFSKEISMLITISSCIVVLLYILGQQPGNTDSRQDTEACQEQLVENLHAEGHAVIFCEIDVKPVCNTDTFVPIHAGLYPNFDDLVDY